MFTFDLNTILKSLNKDVYLDTNTVSYGSRGEQALAVKRRRNRRTTATEAALLAEANKDDRTYIDAKVQGTVDEFIMGIPYPHVPEYDEFYLDTGFMKKRGWRSIAMYLVRRNICTIAEVRKAFNCSTLGDSDWDKLSYDGKLRKVRRTK